MVASKDAARSPSSRRNYPTDTATIERTTITASDSQEIFAQALLRVLEMDAAVPEFGEDLP
jgi:hypothetical protein